MDAASIKTQNRQIYVASSVDNRSHRSHSDDDPIEASRDGSETGALVYLDEVAEARKEIVDFGNQGIETGCKTWQR